MESWKPIKKAKDYYYVSSFGRIKSMRSGKGRILSMDQNIAGYYRVKLRIGNKRKNVLVHRIVAETFISNPENKPQVNHKDGIRTNNHACNLEWVSQRENTNHALRLGLRNTARGERGNSKLTRNNVETIKHNKKGLSTFELSKMFGVSMNQIRVIQRGEQWKHIN